MPHPRSALRLCWFSYSVPVNRFSTAGAGTSAPAPGRLDRIIESGELRVGLSGNQPPLNMKNKSGEIIGLEVDLLEALAESMGLETHSRRDALRRSASRPREG